MEPTNYFAAMELSILLLSSAFAGLLAYGAVRFFLAPSNIHPERPGYEQPEPFTASGSEKHDYKTLGLTTEQANRAFAQLPKVTRDFIARAQSITKNERTPEVAADETPTN